MDTVNVPVPVPPELNVTVFELSEAATVDTDADEVRVMDPTKPDRLVSVIVAVPEEPSMRFNKAWFVEIAKSGPRGAVTEKDTVTE